MKKNITRLLALTALLVLSLFLPVQATSAPNVEISGPVEVTRSQLVNRKVIDYDKWNYGIPWSTLNDYSLWEESGIVLLLSKVNINGQEITPQNGDESTYSRMYTAMGGGTTSFIQKMDSVPTLSNKARKIPVNMPLNVYGQLKTENTYVDEEPYTFKTTYAIDYSSHRPLFSNQFILTDDYRQVRFTFAVSPDGKTYGQFTDPIERITLETYHDTEVPNNAIGLLYGQSMKAAGMKVPAYKLEDGWVIKE